MATFTASFDTQVNIFLRVGSDPNIGVASDYVTEPHPNTGNLIEGFKYDQARWGSELEDNGSFAVPTLWDPSTLGINSEFVLGIGDNNDLKVLNVNEDKRGFVNEWKPEVLHGYYYTGAEEYYLYSDDSVINYPTFSGLNVGNGNTLQLEYDPKEGIPISAKSYRWDSDTGEYINDNVIRRKVDFSGRVTTSGILETRVGANILWNNISTAEKEFILDYVYDPPRVEFNQQVVEKVGEFYDTTVSGLNIYQLELMDTLGVANADANQQFPMTYSPIDRTSRIQLLMDYQGAGAVEWEVVDTLASGVFDQATIDYDLGILKFGDGESGGLPPYGSTIRMGYYKTVAVEYEPRYTRDTVNGDDSDLNPIRRYGGDGFVHLRRTALDVAELRLTAELGEISDNYYGPLYLGNDYAVLNCEALARSGETIEGLEVNFEILSVDTGSFGADDTAVAITNTKGVATTVYNPPGSIEELGGVSDNITVSGTNSTLVFNDYAPPSESVELFLFQIAREDHILGIPRTELASYYDDYLLGEDLSSPEITGVLAGFSPAAQWEILYRAAHNLQTPIVYEDGDLRTGKKTVVAEFNPSGINPHTGTTPAFTPVQPASFDITGADSVSVDFDVALTDITTSGLVKSYMIAGPTNVLLRAWAVNERTGGIIYSNAITVLVDISDSSKGLFNIDALNSAPSGLLLNTEFWNQSGITMPEIEITEPSGLLPLGFRLRSTGITLASALDGLTFLDLQPLDSFGTTSAHEFEVTVSGSP